jgi:two-component system CheB/CheR fusion protein
MSNNRKDQAKAARSRSGRRSVPAHAPAPGPEDFPIVGIGASAGGLDACKKLLGALPKNNGMAFILIQHLDPTHESMMVDLLAGHTSMVVRQATNGMAIEPNHLYVIPPGAYLSVSNGALLLSQPRAHHGARLPFDFLLHSMATEYGARAICIILSGTGTDGSLGLRAVSENSGLVIVQDPDEADYDGMPRNAIATGLVDRVIEVAKIPAALLKYSRRAKTAMPGDATDATNGPRNWLSEIIDLLRTKTAHDFTLYKEGTLQRRIERRMAMLSITPDNVGDYVKILQDDTDELDLLAKDLLINVTSFFRDPSVFDFLAEHIIPDLVRDQPSDHPIRIWVAGCSTGEETYSLAMLFREQIIAANRNVKLQVFASDVDPDAVARARAGLYPETIKSDVSTARLTRFFSKEDQGYRVSPELRSMVVFTVQDVLADPPFSRLDLVSCRNLLIYLRPEAQAKIISLFDFALRDGGILLLGSSETIGKSDNRFNAISKSARLYRHIGRGRPGDVGFAMNFGYGARPRARLGQGPAPSRQSSLAELCRTLVLETYAPAAILINRKHECLYSLGPTDRYLRMASGHPTRDILAMVRQGMRTKLRSAITQASQENTRISVAGGRVKYDKSEHTFSIVIHPVLSEGEQLLLVCFVEGPHREPERKGVVAAEDVSRVIELERELEGARTELQGAIRNLEISGEEQEAINEEALSVNEEYQSANEELMTSKEELQSLNEELTALNGQLQETLERQRTTASDLQSVLYSTDVATLFLDTKLNIRLFTPASKLLFNVISSDVGRPLADLTSLAADGTLLVDARAVLSNLVPIEREIEATTGAWYIRRILPYRVSNDEAAGVVITFVDITERKHAADALETAKREAEQANAAKSRFLGAASHDLRQPLQTLALLQGLLAKSVAGERAQKLVARLDETLGVMTSMLNTLLDINEIEAGTVRTEIVTFPISGLLERLKDEFTYHAKAQQLDLRVVMSSLSIDSDPALLEQMLRNLLSNAFKYTRQGRVLLGCRRRKGVLSIEICDSGIGIPSEEIQAIFNEYHQIDNQARERSRGLGLGLSIVDRLGKLLGHKVRVSSRPGKGSVFAIDIALSPGGATSVPGPKSLGVVRQSSEDRRREGAILVVEDDPEVRDLLGQLLKDDGHEIAAVEDGIAALELIRRGAFSPDLILADYNLPNGMDGLQLGIKLRAILKRQVPVIILTGDITIGTLRDIALENCVRLSKPVKANELADLIQRLLEKPVAEPTAHAPRPIPAQSDSGGPTIYVVDDDRHIRELLSEVLTEGGRLVKAFASCEEFLEFYRPGGQECLLVDAYLPGMSGFELLQRLRDAGHRLPAIMITGNSDVKMAVQAMKAGAMDFIEKPVGTAELLASIERAFELSRDATKLSAWRDDAAGHLAGLTPRQRQIMDMVLAGHPSKNIAADLGISQRTVESHRASIMKRTGSRSLPALARLALVAASVDSE